MIVYEMESKQGNRSYNEDTIRALGVGEEYLFVLADGLGGCGHGELASRIAVQSVLEIFQKQNNADSFMSTAMQVAQNTVLSKQKEFPEAETMGTTMVMLRIGPKTAKWSYIGDSRLYWFRKNRIVVQTADHSVPQMLVSAGDLKPSQVRHHPDRNKLLRVLGRDWQKAAFEVSDTVTIERGDAFLLCSDGFWEYISEFQMCWCLFRAKDPQSWLQRMNHVVEKNGKRSNMDNYSAICVMIT